MFQVIGSLAPDLQKQEALVVENKPDPLAGEQVDNAISFNHFYYYSFVNCHILFCNIFFSKCFGYDIIPYYQTWPTEAELAKADEDFKQKKMRKRTVPRGTSEYQVLTQFTYFYDDFFHSGAYQTSGTEVIDIPGFYFNCQAAWIVDGSDTEESDCTDGDDDGMVLDEREDELTGQEGKEYTEFDGDGASLRFGDSDEETDNDSVMMVRHTILKCLLSCLWSHFDSRWSFIFFPGFEHFKHWSMLMYSLILSVYLTHLLYDVYSVINNWNVYSTNMVRSSNMVIVATGWVCG